MKLVTQRNDSHRFAYISKFIQEKRVQNTFHSQFQLAVILGYKNGQFISNIERGYCGVSIPKAKEFCKALGVSEDAIKSVMLKDYERYLSHALGQEVEKVENEKNIGLPKAII